jgi:hypothetical protein
MMLARSATSSHHFVDRSDPKVPQGNMIRHGIASPQALADTGGLLTEKSTNYLVDRMSDPKEQGSKMIRYGTASPRALEGTGGLLTGKSMIHLVDRMSDPIDRGSKLIRHETTSPQALLDSGGLLSDDSKQYFVDRMSEPKVTGRNIIHHEVASPQALSDAGGLLTRKAIDHAGGNHSALIIEKIKGLCGIPEESAMARFIAQQGWQKLEQVTAIDVGEVMDFAIYCNNGLVKERPMMIHIRMLRSFLLYFMRKERESKTSFAEEDVMKMKKEDFINYCLSLDYHDDLAVWKARETATASNKVGQDLNRASAPKE